MRRTGGYRSKYGLSSEEISFISHPVCELLIECLQHTFYAGT
ncbi:hypothetical protein CAMRE0001_2516 [Campylobacter rectus RM3267]|uniref:Uncharacterized protein n=1 Tax=Campylobacter rectus RM3267 TaxID=553218 RepID=B9D5E9_CAMRE|nr:hypothetical protein CAMRE0001_2516 [Campylobacter rectus RM3267]